MVDVHDVYVMIWLFDFWCCRPSSPRGAPRGSLYSDELPVPRARGPNSVDTRSVPRDGQAIEACFFDLITRHVAEVSTTPLHGAPRLPVF